MGYRRNALLCCPNRLTVLIKMDRLGSCWCWTPNFQHQCDLPWNNEEYCRQVLPFDDVVAKLCPLCSLTVNMALDCEEVKPVKKQMGGVAQTVIHGSTLKAYFRIPCTHFSRDSTYLSKVFCPNNGKPSALFDRARKRTCASTHQMYGVGSFDSPGKLIFFNSTYNTFVTSCIHKQIRAMFKYYWAISRPFLIISVRITAKCMK